MHAGLFDVLHDACDMGCFAVRETVNVNFHGTRKVAVEEHGAFARDHDGLGDIAAKLVHIAHDFHGAATQHEGRADDQWEANITGNGERLFVGGCDAVDRLLEAEFLDKLLETLAIFGKINRVGRGAEDWDACGVQVICELERGLAAELDDHAVQGAVVLFNPQDFHHVFKRQRLEIEAI